MKIKEWLDQQGLTIEDQVPEVLAESLKDIPDDVLEGLSKEDLQIVRALAFDTRNIDSIRQFSEWLKNGDIGLYNIGKSVVEALDKINGELSSIRFSMGLEPVLPMEYICFSYGETNVSVIVRFRRIDEK